VFITPFLYRLKTPARATTLKLEPRTSHPLIRLLGGVPQGEDTGITVAHESLPEQLDTVI
jgi:hypothetical protein